MDFGLGGTEKKKEVVTFKGMGLRMEILGNIKYAISTPIQRKIIPKILNREDVIGISKTGSGKTYAYVIPILQRLLDEPREKSIYAKTRALILVPTYELAKQVSDAFLELSSDGVRPALFTGMGSLAHSFNYLVVGHFEVAVCTPGRLVHMITEITSAEDKRPTYLKVDEKGVKKEISITNQQLLEKITQPEVIVVDEMDRIFEDASLSQAFEQALQHISSTPQFCLFSATHSRCASLIRDVLDRKNIQLVEVLGGVSDHLEASRLEIRNLYVQEETKAPLLVSLLKKEGSASKVLVFTSTCTRCSAVGEMLREMGYTVGVLCSFESEESRADSLKAFKTGSIQVLVSTDVGCRGLDIKGITTVIEYDYAPDRSTCIHRVGRMNRGRNEKGTLFSFIRPGDLSAYLSFLNHIHAEKPRDVSRTTRICFVPDTCHVDGMHSSCSYLGLGYVPSSFYADAQGCARPSDPSAFASSYAKYESTHRTRKKEAVWSVPSVDTKRIPVHPCFGQSANILEEAVRSYKSKSLASSLAAHGSARFSGLISGSKAKPQSPPGGMLNSAASNHRSPLFIPYENIKSDINSASQIFLGREKAAASLSRKPGRTPGLRFTEWKKSNRDRLCKGHLLKRPGFQAGEEIEEAADEGPRKMPKKEGNTRSIRGVLKIREERDKKMQNRQRRRDDPTAPPKRRGRV